MGNKKRKKANKKVSSAKINTKSKSKSTKSSKQEHHDGTNQYHKDFTDLDWEHQIMLIKEEEMEEAEDEDDEDCGDCVAGTSKNYRYKKRRNSDDLIDDIDGDFDIDSKPQSPSDSATPTTKRSRKKAAALIKTPEIMAARRRKVWQLMAKKELGKTHRAKINNHKETITSCKKVSTLCMKVFRQRAMQSQKNMKETIWRAKRLTREMQGYWKRYDRVEREKRRRLEKEAEEQRKVCIDYIIYFMFKLKPKKMIITKFYNINSWMLN